MDNIMVLMFGDEFTCQRATRLARNVALVFGGSALLALSAKVQIPFFPVPMTMQTFAVLAIAMAYGWRLGAATVLALGEAAILVIQH